MVSKEQLTEWRALGIKSVKIGGAFGDQILEVEFFPVTPPAPPLFEPERFSPTTLVPAAPEEEGPPTERPPADHHYKVAPSLAAILRKPSVS